MTVGDRIRKRRQEMGISQAKLGEKIGVTRASVSSVELGKEGLTTERVKRYAEALNTSTFDLLGYNDPEEEKKRSDDDERMSILIENVRLLDEERFENVLKYVMFLRREE